MITYKYYDVLGLKKDDNPSQSEIKKAYHKLAMKYHPDKNKENNKEIDEKFKEMTNAYGVLIDNEKKMKYDQLGDNYEEGNGMDIDPNEIFAQFFGNRSDPFERGGFGSFFNFDIRTNQNMKCSNIKKTLNVTLEEVYNGIDKTMEISVKKVCFNCVKKCNNCNGKGRIKQIRNLGIVQQIMEGICSMCNGEGIKLEKNKNCEICKGEGEYLKKNNANLKINAGFQNNHKTLFKGLGEQPKKKDQEAGDLIILLNIEKNKNFERRGNDILYKTKISQIDAIIGKKIEIEYFNKKKIEINTQDQGIIQNKKEYKIKNKGIEINDNIKGDLIIEYEVENSFIKNKNNIEELKNILKSTLNS